MSPQNHDTQDYYDRPPVRRKRRKRPLAEIQGGLPSRYCCFYWASRQIIALIIGGVKLISRNDKTDPSAGAATGQTAPSNEENQTLLAEAAILAGQYDYDGALTLLGTCTGEDDRCPSRRRLATAAKEGLTVWEDLGNSPDFSFQPHCRPPPAPLTETTTQITTTETASTTSEFSANLTSFL